jgi:integrase
MKGKKGQNQGSVSIRKNGSYLAQISVEGKRISKYFKTKREANLWILDSLNKVQKGMFYSGPQVLVSDYLDQWLVDSKDSVRPKTHIQYCQIIEQHIIPSLGKYKLSELRPEMIQALYNQKIDSGSGVRTVRLIHSVLHCALNRALKLNLIYRNPADAVYRPKLKKIEMKILDENQVRSLLIASRGTRLETLLKVAITTGLRQGEILGLKWSDLDWETHQLHIQRQVQRIPKVGLTFPEPKSAAGRRIIALGPETINQLKEHFNKQCLERKLAGDKWKEGDWIFTSFNGTPIEARNLFREFKNLLVKANLPDIRYHDLRHTAASLMLKQGINPKVVQEILGHSDYSLTMNTYSHLLPGLQKEAAEKMDEITALIEVSLNIEDK